MIVCVVNFYPGIALALCTPIICTCALFYYVAFYLYFKI